MVKGVNFVGLRDAGDPIEIARRYDEQGADELTFLDITASSDERDIILHIIEAVATQVFIPLTVGGGVRSVDDVRRLLNAGADKVEHQHRRGDQSATGGGCFGALWLAVHRGGDRCQAGVGGRRAIALEVFTHGGRKDTGLDAVEWAKKMEALGAGEILLTSMDRDGTKIGFDLELTRAVSDAVSIPGDRQRRRGQSRASGGWRQERPCGCRAGGKHFPLWRIYRAPGQGTYGKKRYRSEAVGMSDSWLNKVNWTHDGLVPAIAQDKDSGAVLMVAWMNREALKRTVESGEAVYWSRSRKKLWHKGEESGHVQKVHAGMPTLITPQGVSEVVANIASAASGHGWLRRECRHCAHR